MTDKPVRLLLSSAKGDLENFYVAFTASGAACEGGYCPELTGAFLRPDCVDGAPLIRYFIDICKNH